MSSLDTHISFSFSFLNKIGYSKRTWFLRGEETWTKCRGSATDRVVLRSVLKKSFTEKSWDFHLGVKDKTRQTENIQEVRKHHLVW